MVSQTFAKEAVAGGSEDAANLVMSHVGPISTAFHTSLQGQSGGDTGDACPIFSPWCSHALRTVCSRQCEWLTMGSNKKRWEMSIHSGFDMAFGWQTISTV